MPLLNTITTPYAEAFLQVAESRNEVDEVVSQAKSILELWNSCPEFSDAMSSPVLEVNQKKAALEKLFSSEVTPSFLKILSMTAFFASTSNTGEAIASLNSEDLFQSSNKDLDC